MTREIPVLALFLTVLACNSKPGGPPIASIDIASGKPFALPFKANGKDLYVWLDLACDDCSFPVDGALRITAKGQTVEAVEVSAGSTKRGGWSGGTRSLEARGVLDAEAQPDGVELTLSGVLTVHRARDYLLHREKKDAPPPRVRLLRLTVTP